MLVRQRPTPKQRSGRGGYTLMEMLVVVAIIVVLAGIGGYYLLPRVDEAKVKADYVQTKTIASACETYKLNNGEWPPNLQSLTMQQPGGGAPILEPSALEPKVGGQFQYDPAGGQNAGLKPDIWVNYPSDPQGGKIGNWQTRK